MKAKNYLLPTDVWDMKKAKLLVRKKNMILSIFSLNKCIISCLIIYWGSLAMRIAWLFPTSSMIYI